MKDKTSERKESSGTPGTSSTEIPCSVESERAVLSCMLMDSDSAQMALSSLREESFYTGLYRGIFKAMKDLAQDGRSIDVVVLSDRLSQRDPDENWVRILADIASSIGTSVNIKEYIVALAFSQMFNLLCERADNVHGGRLPHHVRVLWDEAANTGQVPQLEKLVAVIRSREVSLCLLYQQLAQCKAIYDKHAETILGNMDSVVFLGGREASTIKEISENWLGKATISMQIDSRSRGQSESYSQNNQRLGRELMTPAELATMPGDKCILQLRGLPPFFSPKYDLKRHPNYRYTAEADKQKNAFDLDRLINRRRRPGLNEACTMYEVTVPDDALTEEDEDILNYDDIDDPDAFA